MDALITLLLDVVLLVTGHVVVRVCTLGRWRTASEAQQRIHGAAGALSFRHEGRRWITPTGQTFVGLFFYVALIFAVAAIAATA